MNSWIWHPTRLLSGDYPVCGMSEAYSVLESIVDLFDVLFTSTIIVNVNSWTIYINFRAMKRTGQVTATNNTFENHIFFRLTNSHIRFCVVVSGYWRPIVFARNVFAPDVEHSTSSSGPNAIYWAKSRKHTTSCCLFRPKSIITLFVYSQKSKTFRTPSWTCWCQQCDEST